MNSLFAQNQRTLLRLGIFIYFGYSVYFLFFSPPTRDFFPIRIAVWSIGLSVVALDQLWEGFKPFFLGGYYLFWALVVTQPLVNLALYGISGVGYTISILTSVAVSFFFLRHWHFRIYLLFYLGLSVLVFFVAPVNELGQSNFFLIFITSAIIQMVTVSFVIGLREDAERKSKVMDAILNDTAELIWSVDSKFRLVTFSRSTQTFFRHYFQHDIIAGRSVLEPLPREIRAEWEPLYFQALAGKIAIHEFETRGPSPRTFLISLTPVRREDGQIFGVCGIGRDVTEERERLRSLERATLEAKVDLSLKQEEIRKAQDTLFQLISTQLPHSKTTSFCAVFLPSAELSGDFFEIVGAEGGAVLLMADCSGHGIAASLNAVLLRSVCDKHLPSFIRDRRPGDFIVAVNEDMVQYTFDGKYHSLFAAYFEEGSGALVYAGTGAKPPVLIGPDRVGLMETCRGSLLGFQRGVRYAESRTRLSPGERVLFYSDALVEVLDPSGNEIIFQEKELLKDLSERRERCGDALIDEILARLVVVSGRLPLADDLSVISLGYRSPVRGQLEGVETESVMSEAREKIFSEMTCRDWTSEEVEEFTIGFREIVTNAERHGNQGDPKKKIHISFEIDAAEVNARIRDEGAGFDLGVVPDPVELARLVHEQGGEGLENLFHGRGIWMSRTIFLDSLSYNDQGNEATLRKVKRVRKTRLQA